MSLFHRLIWDSKPKGFHRVIAYDLAGFDYTRLWHANHLSESDIAGMTLMLGEGNPIDYVANPLSIPICSARFGELIRRRCGSGIDLLRPSLYQPGGDLCPEAYSIVNILNELTAAGAVNIAVARLADVQTVTIGGDRPIHPGLSAPAATGSSEIPTATS